jgi:serine protease Do
MTRRSASSIIPLHLLGIGALAALSAASLLAGEKDPAESLDARAKEIFDFNRAGIVKVQATDPHGVMEGTGFYADSSGTIYTGLDAIGDGTNITVIQGMRKLPARLEVADPRTGIAILKVDTTTPFLPLGDSSKVEAYTPLIAIGFPFDKPAVWSAGTVESLDKQFLPNRFFRTTHVRAKLPVQPGFGGAPVLNFKGEVVGIVVAGIEGNEGCYILPINAAEKARADFTRFHQLKPGWVGVSVESTEDSTLPSTAKISTIHPSSPALAAGVREGDILLRVGDVTVRTPEDIFDAAFYLTAGDETTVTVLRNGKEQKFTFTAVESPSASGAPRPMLQETPVLSLDMTPAPRPTAP